MGQFEKLKKMRKKELARADQRTRGTRRSCASVRVGRGAWYHVPCPCAKSASISSLALNRVSSAPPPAPVHPSASESICLCGVTVACFGCIGSG
ncbi:hypothetical protein GY45DRAFT_112593 [Cubamyces sp. BRFM 1775]|nr:hypothetical protein GY45DRAFT_112593 [Cubamyces sp. BRFM 1775]